MHPFGKAAVLDELGTFVRVVRRGTFAQAARELGVPKSTLSRRLNRLEATLRVKLLHRGPRRFTLTTEGTHLFESIHASIDQIEVAVHAAMQGGSLPEGHIRITAPEDFGRLLLLQELAVFGKQWPHITFEVELTNRYVNLVEESFDLAIRAHSEHLADTPSTVITKKLMRSPLCIAQSAGATTTITTLKEVQAQPFILFKGYKHQELCLQHKSGRKEKLSVQGSIAVHDYGAMATLIAQGAGLGLLPRMHIDHGQSKIIQILPDYCVATDNLSLVYPNRQLPHRVSLLAEHLARTLGDSE